MKVNLEIIESATPNHQEKKRPRLHGEETRICCDVVRLLLRSTKTFSFFFSNFQNSKSFWPNYPVNPNVAVFLFIEPTFFSAFLLFLLSDKLSD